MVDKRVLVDCPNGYAKRVRRLGYDPAAVGRDYLTNCINSIVAQTYQNLEIILVDDGSPDGCDTPCDQWACHDSRITVIHHRNRGLSAARNIGFDFSTGAYVVFVDSDDTLEPTYVETLHRAISRMEVPFVMCGYSSRAKNGNAKMHIPTKSPEVVSAEELLARMLGSRPSKGCSVTVTAWGRMCRHMLLENPTTRFPEGKVYEDISIMCSFAQESGEIGLIPNVLYHQRARNGSITHTQTYTNLCDYEHAHERFAYDVKENYPSLSAAVNRYLEERRISALIRWERLARTSNDPKARDQAEHVRRLGLEYRDDLASHADWHSLTKLLLLHVPPSFALIAQAAKQKVAHLRHARKSPTPMVLA